MEKFDEQLETLYKTTSMIQHRWIIGDQNKIEKDQMKDLEVKNLVTGRNLTSIGLRFQNFIRETYLKAENFLKNNPLSNIEGPAFYRGVCLIQQLEFTINDLQRQLNQENIESPNLSELVIKFLRLGLIKPQQGNPARFEKTALSWRLGELWMQRLVFGR